MWPVKMQNGFGVAAYLEHRYVTETNDQVLESRDGILKWFHDP
jgi:hypothetical protein